MKLSSILTRSSFVAIALLNLSLATSAIAEPIIVTRGTHGAARIVNSNNIPVGAKPIANNRVQKATEAKSEVQVQQKAQQSPVRRGSHGAFVLSSK